MIIVGWILTFGMSLKQLINLALEEGLGKA